MASEAGKCIASPSALLDPYSEGSQLPCREDTQQPFGEVTWGRTEAPSQQPATNSQPQKKRVRKQAEGRTLSNANFLGLSRASRRGPHSEQEGESPGKQARAPVASATVWQGQKQNGRQQALAALGCCAWASLLQRAPWVNSGGLSALGPKASPGRRPTWLCRPLL